MSEFQAVANARYSPTKCAFCDTHAGPFIDTGFELIAFGHVYVCMANDQRSGCIRQMARLDGMIDQEIVSEALQERDQLQAELDQLKAELEDKWTAPLSEILDELRKPRTGRKPAPKTETEEVVS